MAATIRRVVDALQLDAAARGDLFSAARVNDRIAPHGSMLPLALTSFVGRDKPQTDYQQPQHKQSDEHAVEVDRE
jgi:hypothetical protein